MPRFETRRRRAVTAVVVGLGLSLVGAACGSDHKTTQQAASSDAPTTSVRDSSAPAAPTFVGKVEGTDALVAIQTVDGTAYVYVCDGKKIWEDLDGEPQGDELHATGIQTSLTASKSGDGFTGTVTLRDGTEHAFSADPARGQAGVISIGKRSGSSYSLTTWIRLADGETRGKASVTTAQTGAGDATIESSSAGAVPPAGQPVPEWRLGKCLRSARKYGRAAEAVTQDPSAANEAAASAASVAWEEACGLA